MLLLRLFYLLLQCTWGFLQSLLGFLLLLALGKQRRMWHGFALMTVFDLQKVRINRFGCISLGMFIFVTAREGCAPDPGIAAHEYGHTFQSLLLGPLYLFAVGIPSSCWALRYRAHYAEYKAAGVAYTSRYPEGWAQNWGERAMRAHARRAAKKK